MGSFVYNQIFNVSTLLVLAIVFQSATASGKLQCKDEQGNGVPWFILYKMPRSPEANQESLRRGDGYAYILPGTDAWIGSSLGVEDEGSIVRRTLEPFRKTNPSDDLLQIVYNDQPADRNAYSTNGHSKGVVLGNKDGGLWLLHTVPKFPTDDNEEEFYPTNGLVNAQVFFCLSFDDSAKLDAVADIFQLSRPNDGKFTIIPDKMKSVYPKLDEFVSTKRFRKPNPTFNTFDLQIGSFPFKVFAKSPYYRREVYKAWVAPTLDTDLDVQSWLAGRGVMSSNCSADSHDIHNIYEKEIVGIKITRDDHSKWAVTPKDEKDHWTCISDLNRMEGQKKRGGVLICTSEESVWKAFNSAIVKLLPC